MLRNCGIYSSVLRRGKFKRFFKKRISYSGPALRLFLFPPSCVPITQYVWITFISLESRFVNRWAALTWWKWGSVAGSPGEWERWKGGRCSCKPSEAEEHRLALSRTGCKESDIPEVQSDKEVPETREGTQNSESKSHTNICTWIHFKKLCLVKGKVLHEWMSFSGKNYRWVWVLRCTKSHWLKKSYSLFLWPVLRPPCEVSFEGQSFSLQCETQDSHGLHFYQIDLPYLCHCVDRQLKITIPWWPETCSWSWRWWQIP